MKKTFTYNIKRIISFFIPSKIKHYYRLKKYPEYRKRWKKSKIQEKHLQEKQRLSALVRYHLGTTSIVGSKIEFLDAASFLFIYEEIFEQEIYKFNTKNKKPYIIDAGANIGLATIYFKKLYPNAQVIAFEPDITVFEVLEKNIKSFDLQDIELIPKGLWDEETVLRFFSEGADGGRIAVQGDSQQITEIKVTRLREYLKQPVDMLKIDIEGAEVRVLEDCKDLLQNVERIFVEYHSFVNTSQNLGKLISILEDNGFRIMISSPGLTSPQPFMKIHSYLGMDMQLNIYGYKD